MVAPTLTTRLKANPHLTSLHGNFHIFSKVFLQNMRE